MGILIRIFSLTISIFGKYDSLFNVLDILGIVFASLA